MFTTRSGAAKLSLIVVTGLIILKVVVTVLTGSISILAQAADSFLDLIAAVITVGAVGIATKPADEEHHFGHGKVEDIAAAVQAVLIFVAGGLIIYSAVIRILTGEKLAMTEAGMGVMAVSIVASIFLSRHLLKVSRATDSAALEANAHNIAADVYSAAAVLAGLVAIRFTGFVIIDPVIALIVSLFILKVGYDVLRRSFGKLIDVRLPADEEDTIRACILKHGGELVSFHDLRTRKSGSWRYIELHLIVHRSVHVEDAHRICDDIEMEMKNRLPGTSVTIHVEPCNVECDGCITPDNLEDSGG
ncbi:MAG: cation diffusion facilitator family transporter [Chloroflexota bacterium]